MFLNFGRIWASRSYKLGSYKKKKTCRRKKDVKEDHKKDQGENGSLCMCIVWKTRTSVVSSIQYLQTKTVDETIKTIKQKGHTDREEKIFWKSCDTHDGVFRVRSVVLFRCILESQRKGLSICLSFCLSILDLRIHQNTSDVSLEKL